MGLKETRTRALVGRDDGANIVNVWQTRLSSNILISSSPQRVRQQRINVNEHLKCWVDGMCRICRTHNVHHAWRADCFIGRRLLICDGIL